jgi:hypothetical protein
MLDQTIKSINKNSAPLGLPWEAEELDHKITQMELTVFQLEPQTVMKLSNILTPTVMVNSQQKKDKKLLKHS